jgi:hypothetical protein
MSGHIASCVPVVHTKVWSVPVVHTKVWSVPVARVACCGRCGGDVLRDRVAAVALMAAAWRWCTLARDEGSSGEKEVLLCRAM